MEKIVVNIITFITCDGINLLKTLAKSLINFFVRKLLIINLFTLDKRLVVR